MKRCRHKRVKQFWWCGATERFISQFYAEQEFDALVCLDCGHWLPLGPARDEPWSVAIEMQAAEIAAAGYPRNEAELDGWLAHELDRSHLNTVSDHAGFLARAIATHEEE